MAYARKPQYSYYPGGSTYRKGRRYTRYPSRPRQRTRATKRVASKKRRTPAATDKTKMVSKRDIQNLVLTQKYGQAQMVTAVGNPLEFGLFDWGSRSRKHYFIAPVSEALRANFRDASKHPLGKPGPAGSVYVTGVSIQFDISHQGPMEAFAVCVPVAQGVTIPEIGVVKGLAFPIGTPATADVKKGAESFGSLWSLDGGTGPVDALCSQALAKYADDGTAFDAPLQTGVLPGGDTSLNGQRLGAHRGMAKWDLRQRPVGGAGVSANHVSESCRSYWKFEKEVPICDANGYLTGTRYAILVGIRYKTETPSMAMPGVQPVMAGWMTNLYVKYNVRVKV